MNSRYSYSTLAPKPGSIPNKYYQEDLTNDPVDMCVFDDVDKSLVGGVLGYRYGPSNENCQLYMADRCAKRWDSVCEIASNKHQAVYPNNATIKGNAMADPQTITGGSTTGNQLVHNAAQRRFCTFQNCQIQEFPFDPTNLSSPMVKRILRSKYGCMPTCSVDPETIDNDPLMNKCLSDPSASYDTLVNICETHQRNGKSLEGTKIGESRNEECRDSFK